MKAANFSKLLLLALVLSVSVTACKKTPKSPTPIFPSRTGTAPKSPDNPNGPLEGGATLPRDSGAEVKRLPTTPEGTQLTERTGLENYDQDREAFRQDTVYFEFDHSNVRPSELPKVQRVADFVKGQASNAVLVEGHCDERGTPEYNRSLGERRADSIREALIQAGIAADRIHTVSFGEDKPADTRHMEEAWAKNRRGEFVLLRPKAGGGSPELR